MKHTVDFKECLKDSPKFRASLEDAENDIEALESRLDKLVKQCTAMIEAGKMFSNASSGFVVGVRDLANYFNDDTLVSTSLSRFAHAMSEMLKYFNILMDQAHRSICKNLNNFIRIDIKKVKETKKLFEKISDDMDAAYIRNSQAPKSKPQECEEANNTLTAMRSCFAHTSLDYVFQVNVLNSKKRFDILDTMLSFMHAQNTFFHQGHDLFRDLETTYMKDIAGQVEELSSKAKIERKEMEERHTLVQQKDLSTSSLLQGDGNLLQTEGYLFKRNSNAFKNYVRRWFCIQDSQLVYRKRTKDTLTVMEDDLRLCTIRQPVDSDRRFCFEVLSPTRSHILQADSDEECQLWVSALNASISHAYKETMHSQEVENKRSSTSSKESSQSDMLPAEPKQSKAKIRMEQLLTIPGNSHCCDCGANEPRWASINLGITLCIECSGIHRGFGVHLSKVRSITLDTWEPEHLKVMLEIGNDVVNRIYEAEVDETIAARATPDCNRTVRESWIRAKYFQRAFIKKLPGVNKSNVLRKWSVRKKTRRSSSQSFLKTSRSGGELKDSAWSRNRVVSEDLSSELLEGGETGATGAVLSVSNATLMEKRSFKNNAREEQASGDVAGIVFGDDPPLFVAGLNKSLDLESSDESLHEYDDEASINVGVDGDDFTTSWEDMSKLDPNLLLYKASAARNLPVMLEALANSADPNWVNLEEDGKTPIMKAVQTGSLAACEFLLLNNAKLDRKDKNGKTALHHATILGHTGQVCQFLKRRADQNAKDNQGQTPLDIAVANANADIVTLLRLAKLNDEMKESDGYLGNPGDETFQDVFRDFTNMASNNPEKLKRK
uniref:Arf-GAP with coiled-coil, ANK repeat and PH domain-containing protein 2 n=1 Tax=Biomphalaria glabrata TaxID=6526 RepID=A0A2C9KZY6_BIOGL